ncbi:MAG: hypothetical protein EPO07_11210 [Verrucomicrobia bacterium]|nr:MAG: hypothetical protein EPO07_11210 [Verrucomicrobiota bacterium]
MNKNFSPLLLCLFFAAGFAFNAQQMPKETPNNFALPSFPAIILDNQFPEVKGKELADVGKYLQTLEYFREFVLENYNKGVIKYVAKLKSADAELEARRRTGRVSNQEYDTYHSRLKEEFENSGLKGDYMQVYERNLARYRSEAKWAQNEKKRLERERLRL